ncbi:MAG: nucleoside hydrolase [Geminicoccaceae bacterium]|nr:nucleoside hydrolase [Geminicoccaceae bacterium]
MARKLVLDCDPGQDDALALLLALASPEEIALAAVTTVAGNVPLELASANARKILELAGRPEVPVHAGCARPVLVPLSTAEAIHGDSGLDGVDLPPPRLPLASEHAVRTIVRTIAEHPPGTVSLCAIGPLTNIALAILLEPAIVPRLAEIVVMGGAIGLGNVTPAAEFNFWVDPHAAAVVFGSGAPITMVPLDLTRRVRLNPERLARIRALGNPVARACADFLAFYDARCRARGDGEGAALHDPCALAWLLRPGLFRARRARVAIETEGRFCRGRSVVSFPADGDPAEVRLLTEIDAEGFFELLIARLARF